MFNIFSMTRNALCESSYKEMVQVRFLYLFFFFLQFLWQESHYVKAEFLHIILLVQVKSMYSSIY